MFLRSTFFIDVDPKFLDNGSQPLLNGSPQNLHTSLMWGQALKPTFEKFYPTPKIGGNVKFRRRTKLWGINPRSFNVT